MSAFFKSFYLILHLVSSPGGAGGGTNLIGWYDEINRLMRTLGGGAGAAYQLTDIDLSPYLSAGETLPHAIG